MAKKKKVKTPEQLREYQRKRDLGATPEPGGTAAGTSGDGADGAPRFVIQEHHATRLHWDLRLEHEGVLLSWAIPNGLPLEPKENRKAVRTEDHPLEYLDFHGEIPKGQYGAGTMEIWDHGVYDADKIDSKKVIANLHGQRIEGTYALFQAGSEKDWMIHRMDPPSDPDREPMPERVVPMLAGPSELPSDDGAWAYEIKWDGVRAIAYAKPGRLRLESRNLNDITAQYPDLRALTGALGAREAVLDGEIVAYDDEGRPSFERLQQRMHHASESTIRRRMKSHPVTYVIFDLLYLDGRSLMEEPYGERRARLEELDLNGDRFQTPAHRVGGGAELLAATEERELEGIVAKRLDSPYEPGKRSRAWIKVKNTSRQELVIGGWLPGEGRRKQRIGALLVGVQDDDGALRFSGRVGTGFTDSDLTALAARLAPLERDSSPFGSGAEPPKESVFVEPELVAEVEFREWTREGMLRAPSYKGLRDDKEAVEVERESVTTGAKPAAGGKLEVTVEDRTLRLSNLDKVLYPQAGFTKGELIDYYARIAPVLLGHLHDRPLTLKRYPNGVEESYFYEKRCPPHAPDWVQTAPGPGDRDGKPINYTLANDLPTLVWLANLADLELHPLLSLAEDIQRPTAMVFDLDPGDGADILDCCEIGLLVRGMFDGLGLASYPKTSGSKGMQVYVPLNSDVGYDRTKTFAKSVAETFERQLPDRVVSRMAKKLRKGKVLIDWSQNDDHKTTICVYSLRGREHSRVEHRRPTVSTPLAWDEVQDALDAGEAERLSFEHNDVLERVDARGDLFAPVLSERQELPAS